MISIQLADILRPLMGGALIGLAVTLMLVFNGRVAGISGILNGFLSRKEGHDHWRGALLAGLLVGGFLAQWFLPSAFVDQSGRPVTAVLIAGLLVGFGTVMGGGCTSGHGICGLSRFSIRSLIATLTFMAFGFFVASFVHGWWGPL